jgi:hypothetical protein
MNKPATVILGIIVVVFASLGIGLMLGFTRGQGDNVVSSFGSQVSNEELAQAGFTVREPASAAAATQETAVSIANTWMSELFGPDDAAVVLSTPPVARFVLLTAPPNVVDVPTWVVRYTNVAGLENRIPCGGASVAPGTRCVPRMAYILVDDVHQDAYLFHAQGDQAR